MNIHGHSTVKELRRTREGRIVAGVCSGAAEFIGIDANILRIGLAVATFFGGLGVGIYAVAWLLIPEETKRTSIVQDLIGKQKSDPRSTWHQAQSYWDQGVQNVRKEWGPRDQAPSSPAPAPQQPAARPASPVDEPPTTV
ncbi:PspC domain-containing protein [Sphaerisporangium album]|uniref:PspC domain-containing protein n=2 Tax=Sphaerisporangium album TaxID=509200 RepID=A0A367EVD5_9ACTN|nr:PspC domain-containing protein [Sphaerisporangium album]